MEEKYVLSETAVAFLWGFAAMFMFIAALLLVYNLLVLRRIHRFAKSVYKNLQDGTPIVYANLTRVWMWISGIVCCVNTLSALTTLNIFSIAGAACNAAAFIIIAMLLGKYFCSVKVDPINIEQ